MKVGRWSLIYLEAESMVACIRLASGSFTSCRPRMNTGIMDELMSMLGAVVELKHIGNQGWWCLGWWFSYESETRINVLKIHNNRNKYPSSSKWGKKLYAQQWILDESIVSVETIPRQTPIILQCLQFIFGWSILGNLRTSRYPLCKLWVLTLAKRRRLILKHI